MPKKEMSAMDVFRFKHKLDKQLTPLFAHKLLADMPWECRSIYYDVRCKKFFKSNEFCQLLAWSKHLNNWILWLHKESEMTVLWSLTQIQNTACQYKYQIGDKVIYYGLCNDDESCVYEVVGFDSKGLVMVSDGVNQYGGFFMDRWRLATLEEQKAGKRL